MFDYILSKGKSVAPVSNLDQSAKQRKTTLEPILENQAAYIAHLKKPVNEYIKMMQ